MHKETGIREATNTTPVFRSSQQCDAPEHRTLCLMVLNELKNVFHIGKVIIVSMHMYMYMMDFGLLALSETERQ